MKMKEIIKKYFMDYSPFELLMCPYCGYRLNRVGKNNLLPTSCRGCNRHDINPHIENVIIISNDESINNINTLLSGNGRK